MLVHDFSSQQRYQKSTLIKLYTLNFLNSLPQTYTGDPRVRPWLNQGPTLYFAAPTKDPRVRPWLNQGPTLYFVAPTKDPRVRPWLNQGPTLYFVAPTKDPRVRPWLKKGRKLKIHSHYTQEINHVSITIQHCNGHS